MENEQTELVEIDESRIPMSEQDFNNLFNEEQRENDILSLALIMGKLDEVGNSQKEIISPEVERKEQKEHSESQDYDTNNGDADDLNELSESERGMIFEFCYCSLDGMNGKRNGDIQKRIEAIQVQNWNREQQKILRAIKPSAKNEIKRTLTSVAEDCVGNEKNTEQSLQLKN